jgi:hypothetical protein
LGLRQRGDEASQDEDSKSVVTEKVRGCSHWTKQEQRGLEAWANYLSSGSGFFLIRTSSVQASYLLPGVAGNITKLCIITSGFSIEGAYSPE